MAEATLNKSAGKTDLNRHILAVLEPTIKLDEIKIESNGEEKGGDKMSKEPGSYIPYVKINGYTVQVRDLNSVIISVSGFLPTIMVSFTDSSHQFSADSVPRDGDVISIRIAAKENDTFKDIRADFLITSVMNFESDPMINPMTRRTYTFSGILKVPGINAEECISFKPDTSDKHLMDVSKSLKLGFATNIDKTDDKMTRVCPYISKLRFMEDTISHSYIDEKSFQVGFIDLYYYLNFIELNKIFNSKNEIEETIMHMFNVDYSQSRTMTEDLSKIKGKMVLTNHSSFGGSSQHIQTNTITNNAGGVSFTHGSKRKLQFFEDDSDEKLVSFDVKPISTDKDKLRDNEEPLKGRRGEKDWENEVRQKYVGRISVDKEHGNMHLNYYTSSITNSINRAEIYKMGLDITLNSPNLGLYKGMKIPVLIFTKNAMEGAAAKHIKEEMEKKGFKSMGKELIDEKIEKDMPYADKEILDEFKSGFYIIDDIQYEYQVSSNAQFIQRIKLLRREWPTLVRRVDAKTMEADAAPAPEPTPPPTQTQQPPAPAPAPEPAPAPAPEKPKEETTPQAELEITINIPNTTATQKLDSAWASGNQYVTFTGTWKSNRDKLQLEEAFIEFDGSDVFENGNGLTLKKNGTLVFDAYGSSFEDGAHTAIVTIKAEGKTFKSAPAQITVTTL